MNIVIGDTLDMAVSYFFIPDLQRFTANTVQYREETRLKCVLKHFYVDFRSGAFTAVEANTLSPRILIKNKQYKIYDIWYDVIWMRDAGIAAV